MNIDNVNIAGIFDQHARAWGGKPAILSPEGVVTHTDFASRLRRTANHLRDIGAGPGARIGLALGDTADHLVCLFAIARLGAAVVPMDVRWRTSEKARLAKALGTRFVLVEPASDDDDLGCPTLAVDDAWHARVNKQADTCPPEVQRHMPAMFSLSSGTTAAPSGPILAHHQLFYRFINQWATLGINAQDRFLAATPLYFGATRSFCLSTLYAGGSVALLPQPYELEAIPAAVTEYGATSAFLVPTLLRRLLRLSDDELAPLGSLRMLASSGAPLHPEEKAEVRARICENLYDYYGTTEGGGISILAPGDRQLGEGSVGRPVFMVDVEIVDDADTPLPNGEVGRIRYRGPGVASADSDAAGDYAASAHVDGWFYPGDLGLLDSNGFLHLRGRQKDVIVRGGVNVYPLEIEQALLQLDGVLDAAVVTWPSREFGEEIAAFLVTREKSPDIATIERECGDRLAPYKQPRAFIQIDSLPKNSSGKVLKAKLQERLEPL